MAAEYGGYDYSFVDKDLDKYTCNTICSKVLRDPHITSCCGQVFCESCLNYYLTKQDKKSCPFCRAEGEDFMHFLDKRLKREIDSLKIYCTYKEEGCQWVGDVGSLKDHLEWNIGCGYVEVFCTQQCKTVVKRKELENHLENICPFRPYKCEYCLNKYMYIYINIKRMDERNLFQKFHHDECPEFPLECPNKCGAKDIKRKDMEDHRSLQCPEEIIKCPNECAAVIRNEMIIAWKTCTTMKRKDMKMHIEECHLRPYQCEHCGLNWKYNLITTRHYANCPEFPLECPNKCGVKGIKRKDMKDHRSQCPEEPVQCPNKCQNIAGIEILRKTLSKHLKEECRYRPYKCEHCGSKDTYQAITGKVSSFALLSRSHYDDCPEFPLECPNKCGIKSIKRKEMKNHHNECPEEQVQCPFAEAGCNEKFVRRELEQHMSTTQQQHLLMVMGAYKEMKKELKETKQALKEKTEEVQHMKEILIDKNIL